MERGNKGREQGKHTPFWLCLEGIDGVGKSTQSLKIVEWLRSQGKHVFFTSEPGTAHSPMTMFLKDLMVYKEYDERMTDEARVFLSQAARSIHMEKVILPLLRENTTDIIVQDRGMLSGLAYSSCLGHEISVRPDCQYSLVILIVMDVKDAMKRMEKREKREDGKGDKKERQDVFESRGEMFLAKVQEKLLQNMYRWNTIILKTTDKESPEELFQRIKKRLQNIFLHGLEGNVV